MIINYNSKYLSWLFNILSHFSGLFTNVLHRGRELKKTRLLKSLFQLPFNI